MNCSAFAITDTRGTQMNMTVCAFEVTALSSGSSGQFRWLLDSQLHDTCTWFSHYLPPLMSTRRAHLVDGAGISPWPQHCSRSAGKWRLRTGRTRILGRSMGPVIGPSATSGSWLFRLLAVWTCPQSPHLYTGKLIGTSSWGCCDEWVVRNEWNCPSMLLVIISTLMTSSKLIR